LIIMPRSLMEKRKSRQGGVGWYYSEGDGRGNPDIVIQKGLLVFMGEVVSKEGHRGLFCIWFQDWD